MPDIRINSFLTPPLSTTHVEKTNSDTQKETFSSILSREIGEADGVKFSKHAQARLESRNISIGSDDMQKLSSAVDKAAEKGVQDSLVLMNNLAFIVSVPDRTVVTAMPVSEAGQNVFTNIDGAVVV